MRKHNAFLWKFVAIALTSSLWGCGSKDDVSLLVFADNLKIAKVANPFGFKLSGSVDVIFDLGTYAGETVTADAISLQLLRNDKPILAAAKLTPASATLPVTLSPGSKTTLPYVIVIEQLQPAEITELCAGPLAAGGTVRQKGRLDTIRIITGAVTATGCP